MPSDIRNDFPFVLLNNHFDIRISSQTDKAQIIKMADT